MIRANPSNPCHPCAISRLKNGTRMTRIERIFTDNFILSHWIAFMVYYSTEDERLKESKRTC